MCVHFVTCPKQGLEIEAVVLHRVGFLAYFCPKQGQDFKPSSAPLYPNMGQVPPPGIGQSKEGEFFGEKLSFLQSFRAFKFPSCMLIGNFHKSLVCSEAVAPLS